MERKEKMKQFVRFFNEAKITIGENGVNYICFDKDETKANRKQVVYIGGMISNGGAKLTKETLDRTRIKFEQAEEYLERHGYEVVNPMKLPTPYDNTWMGYMKQGITAMLSCDAVYFIEDWVESKGAKLEYDVALKIGMEFIY